MISSKDFEENNGYLKEHYKQQSQELCDVIAKMLEGKNELSSVSALVALTGNIVLDSQDPLLLCEFVLENFKSLLELITQEKDDQL
jgi:hypothetical protein